MDIKLNSVGLQKYLVQNLKFLHSQSHFEIARLRVQDVFQFTH